MNLSKSEISKLEKAKTVGGEPSVSLTDGELANLLRIVALDLDLEIPDGIVCEECVDIPNTGFFEVPIAQLECSDFESTFSSDSILKQAIGEMCKDTPDVFTYYTSLVQLHSYRRKFKKVCDVQPIPELEGIVPRGLLEIGKFDEEKLVSWIVWRKFLYDIDNRSAQTTGYLFEPILTESIGGASYSSRESPIERTNRKGGRQVDCIVGETAYEFKMRMTIAASGQGRFSEELQFAEDAYNSEYKPVLLVLDPTPSTKLSKLSAEFRDYDGEAYVGDDAWSHLQEKSGDIMPKFIEKYIRNPISKMDEHEDRLESLGLTYRKDSNSITVTIGDETIELR